MSEYIFNNNHSSTDSFNVVSQIQDLQSDSIFKNFFDDNFNPKSFTLVEGVTISEQINKISNGIEMLNKHLHNLICEKFEDLLDQASNIEEFEDILKGIHSKIQILLTNLERLRAKLIEPYNKISFQIVLLNRLQITCDLLRRVIRIIHLNKRLQQNQLFIESNTITREITKVAQCINEIEFLLAEEPKLNEIEIIQNDCSKMRNIKNDLIEISHDLLMSGLQKQDQIAIGSALQVFYSLKMLNDKVNQIIVGKQEYISKSIKDAIDFNCLVPKSYQKGPGGAVIPMTYNQNVNFRNSLWNNIESLFEKIYISFNQINILYKILKKRRDSVTHTLFIDEIDMVDVVNEFLIYTSKSLSEQICKASSDYPLLKNAFEIENTKFLSMFSELWKRIAREDKDLNAEKVFAFINDTF